MFSQDPESPVDEVEFKFLHPKLDGFWDWPKKIDHKHVSAKFILFGPCMPEAPTKKGFKFAGEKTVKGFYRVFKDSLRM